MEKDGKESLMGQKMSQPSDAVAKKKKKIFWSMLVDMWFVRMYV